MMNDRLAPELQDLHAFVDNQLAPEDRRRVEARLAGRSPGAASGGRLRGDPRRPAGALCPGAGRARARAARAPARGPDAGCVRWGRWPPASPCWLVGGFAGMQLERSRLEPLAGGHSLAREAAMAYAVYAPEVRHPVEVPGDQEEHLVAWLTKRLGTPIRAPRLESLGFALLGGRLLASDDGPGALLMYEDAQGRRVVLYACLNEEKGRDTAFRFGQEEGVSVFYWLEGPLSYGLAGDLGRPEMLALAEAVYRQISS